MPYIVTTLTPNHDDIVAGCSMVSTLETRTAVATRDEAREAVEGEVSIVGVHIDRAAMDAARNMPESGGTIGPLPDGTVIEVKQVELIEIAQQAFPRDDRAGMWPAPDVIIAAFNNTNN